MEGNNDNKTNKFKDSVFNIAKKVSDKTVSVSENVRDYLTNKKYDKFLPIYESNADPETLRQERVIRVVNYDSRLDKELFKDSVGFYEKTPNRKIPTFYSNYIKKLGLSFYPGLSESVFIADPCIEGKYIEIDDYFNYMKQVRVNELTVIAQSLGAKHVDIRLITKDKKSVLTKIGAIAGVGLSNKTGDAGADAEKTRESESFFVVWGSTYFKTSVWNGNPVVPDVLYFRNESDIQSLIQMAMSNRSKITKRTYRMKASSSSGISMTEASNIGSSLKIIKIKAGNTFESRAKEESESLLEYTIEF